MYDVTSGIKFSRTVFQYYSTFSQKASEIPEFDHFSVIAPGTIFRNVVTSNMFMNTTVVVEFNLFVIIMTK